MKQNNKFIKEKNILPLDNLINKFIFYLKKNKIYNESFIDKLEYEKLFSQIIISDIEMIYNN